MSEAEKRKDEKTYLSVEEKRRSRGKKRREKRKGCWCFFHKGKREVEEEEVCLL